MKTIGTRAEVFHGTAEKTSGGLLKKDLKFDKKDGRIKSKAQVKAGKSNPALKGWLKAQKDAKKSLGIDRDEFVLMKGALLKETRRLYKKDGSR